MQTQDVQSPECVTTPKVAPGQDSFGFLVCCEHSDCYNTFFNNTGYDNQPIKGVPRQYCSRICKSRSRDKKEMQDRVAARSLKQQVVNIVWAHLNRDRYIGFDGKYEGPLNQCFTIEVAIRKDRGYHPMPIDVHVRPVEPKFAQVTPEDVDWAQRQRAFQHSQSMPRPFKTFCTNCVEMVIDTGNKKVRATKGVYLPIEHDCARVRVYDLQGVLLEVKEI